MRSSAAARARAGDVPEQGFIEGDDSEGPCSGNRHRRTVQRGRARVVNPVLRDEVMVFGFLDNRGVGDCYFARAPTALGQAFFCICIESGMASGGPYEIFVSPAMDWEEFLRQLPPA